MSFDYNFTFYMVVFQIITGSEDGTVRIWGMS